MPITLDIQSGITSEVIPDILLPRPVVNNEAIAIANRATNGFLLDFQKSTDVTFNSTSLVYELYISYENNISTLLDTLENGTLVSSETDISSLGASDLIESPTIWSSIIVRNPANRVSLYNPLAVGFDINAPAITVTSVTSASATISLASVAGATGYEYQLNEQPIVEAGDVNDITINNLSVGAYTIKVRATGNTGTSLWSNIETFEVSELQPPTYVENSFSNTIDSITVSYSGNSTSFDLRINGGDVVNSFNTTYTFNNLTPGTQYTVEVRSSEGPNKSNWTSIQVQTDVFTEVEGQQIQTNQFTTA